MVFLSKSQIFNYGFCYHFYSSLGMIFACENEKKMIEIRDF